ncbi:hypothetical protein D3C86_1861770 [compost metagenome]
MKGLPGHEKEAGIVARKLGRVFDLHDVQRIPESQKQAACRHGERPQRPEIQARLLSAVKRAGKVTVVELIS